MNHKEIAILLACITSFSQGTPFYTRLTNIVKGYPDQLNTLDAAVAPIADDIFEDCLAELTVKLLKQV